MTKRHIDIPDELWRETKVAAAKDGFTATHIVNAALTQWLARFHDGPTRAALVPQDPVLDFDQTDTIDKPQLLGVITPKKAEYVRLEDIERRTAPLPAGPSFGQSQAAPKPLKKGK